jgi:hypothetical protein
VKFEVLIFCSPVVYPSFLLFPFVFCDLHCLFPYSTNRSRFFPSLQVSPVSEFSPVFICSFFYFILIFLLLFSSVSIPFLFLPNLIPQFF